MSLPKVKMALRRHRIECSDEEVGAFLASWLDASHLPWPGEVICKAHVVEELPAFTEDRPEYAQTSLSFWSGPPENTVRLVWTKVPAMALVHATAPQIEFWLTRGILKRAGAAERTFLLLSLTFALRRLGWYHVHGAALTDPEGRGWLLAGNSKSGKSTTTALLARRGWNVACDDAGFLVESRDGTVEVHGYRSPVALRAGAVELLKPAGGTELDWRRKLTLWPEDLGGGSVPSVTPHFLLFPTVGESTSVTPIDRVRAVAELVKWSLWVLVEPLRTQEHLDRLARLARQTQSFRVTVGPDFVAAPSLLETLVHAAATAPTS